MRRGVDLLSFLQYGIYNEKGSCHLHHHHLYSMHVCIHAPPLPPSPRARLEYDFSPPIFFLFFFNILVFQVPSIYVFPSFCLLPEGPGKRGVTTKDSQGSKSRVKNSRKKKPIEKKISSIEFFRQYIVFLEGILGSSSFFFFFVSLFRYS